MRTITKLINLVGSFCCWGLLISDTVRRSRYIAAADTAADSRAGTVAAAAAAADVRTRPGPGSNALPPPCRRCCAA